MENSEDLVVLDYYEYPVEADIVKGMLETNGVPSIVTSQLMSSSVFPMPATAMGGVKLMVFRKDLELAHEIMNSQPIDAKSTGDNEDN